MRKWYPIVIVAIAVIASLAVFGRLPERMPVHWNASGEIDGYGSRLVGAFLMPAVMLGLAALIPALPRIDPRGRNYEKFRPTYHLVLNALLTFTLALHGVLLASALGYDVPVARLVPLGVGLLLVLLGNVLPRTRSNWMFGIRTPWTLSNERVWERTHRVGGYLMLAAGLLVIAAALLAPGSLGFPVILVAVMGAAIGSVLYSYIAWRQETRS